MGLSIDEMHGIATELRASERYAGIHIDQQLGEQSRLLTNLIRSQSSLQNLFLQQISSSSSRHPALVSANGLGPLNCIIHIRAHVSKYPRSPCTLYCRCVCHGMGAIRSPAWPRNVIGALFIGYSGYPVRNCRRCTEIDCDCRSTIRSYVHYMFPNWFLTAALAFSITTTHSRQVCMSLTIRRIVPVTAEIFRLVVSENLDGMKRLFSMGLASPDDSGPNGASALAVGHVGECYEVTSHGNDST